MIRAPRRGNVLSSVDCIVGCGESRNKYRGMLRIATEGSRRSCISSDRSQLLEKLTKARRERLRTSLANASDMRFGSFANSVRSRWRREIFPDVLTSRYAAYARIFLSYLIVRGDTRRYPRRRRVFSLLSSSNANVSR